MIEAFCHCVVIAAGRLAHALTETGKAQPVSGYLTRVLASAIGVEDEASGWLTPSQGQIQRLHGGCAALGRNRLRLPEFQIRWWDDLASWTGLVSLRTAAA
jgi:hypothetical protein